MKIIHQFSIFCMCLIVFTLLGCDRNDYVTWECHGVAPTTKSFNFILEGSTMKLSDRTIKFCGSLGNSSFFDDVCPVEIDKSKVLFISKKGDYIEANQAYRCKPL